MAFKVQGLGLASVSGNQGSIENGQVAVGAPRIYTYNSDTDTIAEIQSPDYFLSMQGAITHRDLIYISGIDGTSFLTFIIVDDFHIYTQPAIVANVSNGSITVLKLAPDTLAYFLQSANNLSDLSNTSTARGNLGLGSAALLDVTDFLRPSQNLNDVSNKATSFNTISPILAKGDLIAGTGVNTSGSLPVGADLLFLQADSSTPTGLKWTGVADADATKIVKSVNQTAHGFALQDILKRSGGAYAKAQSNTLANSQVVGMVLSVTDANNFILVMDGYCTGLSSLTADTSYYLSASTAGALTSTEPNTATQITRCLLIADTATSGYFSLGKSTFTTNTWLQSANNLSDIVSQSTARTNLGLGTASTFASSAFVQTANNLSDLASASAARTNLGLGTIALLNSPLPVSNGGTAATSAGATAANNIGALAINNNLSDVNNVSTSRTNLGLGTAAQQNSTYFCQTANNLSDVLSSSTSLANLGGASTATTITINGTANEITSSAGAQSLAANRVWTLSLPSAMTFAGKTITGGSYASASATSFTFTSGSIGTAVTGVTQAPLASNTTIATTKYVDDAVSAGGGGGAPTTSTYITQTPDAGLGNEQALSLLTSGIMKSTTATGVVSIAVKGTDYYAPGSTDVVVSDGGTGRSTLTTAYGVLCAGTTATGNVQTLASLGTSGQVLTSNGAAALPSFQAAAGGASTALMPGLPNNWYTAGAVFSGMGASATTRPITLNTLYLRPFLVTKSTTYTAIGVLIGGVAAGSSNMCIYNDNGSSAPTGSPVANSTSGSMTNVAYTFSSYTFSSAITLNPGLYWIAIASSAITSIYCNADLYFECGGTGLGSRTPSSSNISLPSAGYSQSFTYSTTMPTIATVTQFYRTDNGDGYLFLKAQ